MRHHPIVLLLIASLAPLAMLGCPAFATDDYEVEAEPGLDASADGADGDTGDQDDGDTGDQDDRARTNGR